MTLLSTFDSSQSKPVTNGTLVNELSNTMDLPSTLIRAQSLFRRFSRTVEAFDKKNNFPTPTVRQRRPIADTDKDSAGGTSESVVTTGNDASNQSTQIKNTNSISNTNSSQPRPGSSAPQRSSPSRGQGRRGSSSARKGDAAGKNPAKAITSQSSQEPPPMVRVISPELRKLLSRKVEKLDKRDVKAHGGGVGS